MAPDRPPVAGRWRRCESIKQPPELEPLFGSSLSFFAERHQGLTYSHLHLGQPRWCGGLLAGKLGLKDPVDFKVVDRVFTSVSRQTPASQAEARNPVVATLLYFEADPQIAGLWALGSQEFRRSIPTLHQRSVDRTMADLHALAGAASFVAKSSVPHGFVYAAFTRCANDGLQPCLRTSVLVSCRFALPEGQTVENPLSLRHGRASGRFKRWEGLLFENAIGPLGVHSETSLAPGLFRLPRAENRSGGAWHFPRTRNPSPKESRADGESTPPNWDSAKAGFRGCYPHSKDIETSGMNWPRTPTRAGRNSGGECSCQGGAKTRLTLTTSEWEVSRRSQQTSESVPDSRSANCPTQLARLHVPGRLRKPAIKPPYSRLRLRRIRSDRVIQEISRES